MRASSSSALAAALLLLAAAAPAAAQQAARAEAPAARAEAAPGAVEVYRREVFAYPRGARPDPFQPLMGRQEAGLRLEDLRLTSIVYSTNPRFSLAIFAEGDSARRYRVRVGQKQGAFTVLRIYPRRVDVRVDDFGSSRVESISLRRAERVAQTAAQAQAAAGGEPPPEPGQTAAVPVQAVPQQPAPQAPQAAPGTRGRQQPAAQQPPQTSTPSRGIYNEPPRYGSQRRGTRP